MEIIEKYNTLEDTVIKGGYCIGCGVCTQIPSSPYIVSKTKFGQYEAVRKENSTTNEHVDKVLKQVCPFSGESLNEDQIGFNLFGSLKDHNSKLGYFSSTFVGYAVEGKYRSLAASGGLSTWLLDYLLKNNIIDGVIHVTQAAKGTSLFEYSISRSSTEISFGAKSKYYPIELSKVLDQIRSEEGVFALIGVPCFIKAYRLLAISNPELNYKIKYCVGLVCGHLKSESFSKMFGWQCGIRPNELRAIDFRTKLEGRPSNDYGVTVSSDDKTIISAPISKLFGTNWGYGLFKYKACDYCDDVFAETADVVFGDAWLPELQKDSRGTNVIVIRNKEIDEIFQKAYLAKKIYLKSISVEEVIESQSAGLRHRRESLSFRLFTDLSNDIWVPTKRVPAEVTIDKLTQKRQIQRIKMRDASHSLFYEAVMKDDFSIFVSGMGPYIDEYKKLYKPSFLRQIFREIKKRFFKINFK